MRFDAGQRAHQQILQKMRAEFAILFLRELLAQVSDLSRRCLCNNPFFCRGQFLLADLSVGG